MSSETADMLTDRSEEPEDDPMEGKRALKFGKSTRISEARKTRRNLSPYKHQVNEQHQKLMEKLNIPRLNLKFAKQIQRIINEGNKSSCKLFTLKKKSMKLKTK